LWQHLFGVCGEPLAYAWCHYELKAHFHPSLLIVFDGSCIYFMACSKSSKYL